MQTIATPARHTIRRTWALPQYFAVLGLIFLFWQAWTIIAWLADGPHQITAYRDDDSASWYAARVYESFAVLIALGMGSYVVRGVIRARKLTFDALFAIAGLSTLWIEHVRNTVQPLFMYSSNWVNVNSWCGDMPLRINPDCGKLPVPILFYGGLYPFGFLLFAIILNAIQRKLKERYPDISLAMFLLATLVLGIGIGFAVELPMYLFRLWAVPGSPDFGALFTGSGRKYPWIQWLAAGVFFATLASVRYFRNDKGERIAERKLEHLTPGRRTGVSLLALIGMMNLSFVVVEGSLAVAGFYADPYPRMPAHIVNGMCDAPGITGTDYGPCPGSPDFTMPIRHIPGDSS